MGCDIHAYVEYADWDSDTGPYWKNFTSNGGSRNYVMFGVLAGVRCPDAKLFEPKGMPEGKLGFETADAYWLHIAPADKPQWADGEGWTSLDRAEAWVASGASVPYRDEKGELKRVSHPDWHSHSWLSAGDLDAALRHYEEVVERHYPEKGVPAEWRAMLAAMREFEVAGAKTRLVFWFDN